MFKVFSGEMVFRIAPILACDWSAQCSSPFMTPLKAVTRKLKPPWSLFRVQIYSVCCILVWWCA